MKRASALVFPSVAGSSLMWGKLTFDVEFSFPRKRGSPLVFPSESFVFFDAGEVDF